MKRNLLKQRNISLLIGLFLTFSMVLQAQSSLINATSEASNAPFEGTKSTWKGGDRYDFKFSARNSIVVVPQKAANGNPWIIRPAFFGAFAIADSALLAQGFHIVYFDVTHLYGSPRAQKLFSGFYDYLVKNHQFSPKVTLEGFSRGGLFVQNWAVNNPEKVACLYVDAPVCDLKSWPGRKDAKLWSGFLAEYQITDAQADTLKCSPVDQAALLAKTKLPILSVCGDEDKTVPYYFAVNGK